MNLNRDQMYRKSKRYILNNSIRDYVFTLTENGTQYRFISNTNNFIDNMNVQHKMIYRIGDVRTNYGAIVIGVY